MDQGRVPVEQELTDFKLLRSDRQFSDKFETASSLAVPSEDKRSSEEHHGSLPKPHPLK